MIIDYSAVVSMALYQSLVSDSYVVVDADIASHPTVVLTFVVVCSQTNELLYSYALNSDDGIFKSAFDGRVVCHSLLLDSFESSEFFNDFSSFLSTMRLAAFNVDFDSRVCAFFVDMCVRVLDS